MSKRPAEEEAPGASPLKKSHLEEEVANANGFNDNEHEYFYPHINANDGDDDDDDDDYTSMQTPSFTADRSESPVTAATTPRIKFPSDYKTLACTWPGCGKSFNRPARLRDHMNSHTNSRPHKCPYPDCGKDYIEHKHLKQHIKASHENERKYACARPGCGKTFVTGTRLKRHQAVHEGADRFRCSECGQSFRKKETLGKHARKEHLGQPAYPCAEPGCDAGFDTKPALNRHRQREHGEAKYWCAECRAGFTADVLLQAHMRQEHQHCLFCEYKAASASAFQNHIDIYHSGKSLDERRTVACPRDGCGKKFTKKSNLNAHVRTAHDGFRFVCGRADLSATPGLESWDNNMGCGDGFSTKVRLEDHVRFLHLGQQRPKLSTTEAAVDVIDELAGVANAKRQSIRCPDCDEGFGRYFDLNLHIAKAHDPDHQDEGDALFLSHDFTWTEAVAEGDVAQVDFDPADYEWMNEQTNLLLLGGGQGGLNIDPMLVSDTL